MELPKKIVVIGPESTGKSTLCQQLSEHYNMPSLPEFAREYLEEHGTDYTFENLLAIAKAQIRREEEYINGEISNKESEIRNKELEIRNKKSEIRNKDLEISNKESEIRNKDLGIRNHSPFTGQPPMLFIDTDMYVMKVWCEFAFDKCHSWILNQIAVRKYDLYLFCNIDLPWTKDKLREYPDIGTRAKLYHHYKDILINQATPWVDISGGYEQRFKKAVNAINSLFA